MEEQHYQAVLQLEAASGASPDRLKTDLEHFVAKLVSDASGLAFGPVGGIDFSTNTVELEFTVVARDTADLYATLGRISDILFTGVEYEFAGTSARRETREPVPA